jgi:hypothetical protein
MNTTRNLELKMAFPSKYPNTVNFTGEVLDVIDYGPSPSSGKKARFLIVNPSTTKPQFDTKLYGYIYGKNAADLVEEGKGCLVTIVGRIGSDSTGGILLTDQIFFLDEEDTNE